MENKFRSDFTVGPDRQEEIENNKLMVQLANIKDNLTAFINEAERRIGSLESKTSNLSAYDSEIRELKDHIKRMETGLHLDFKTTQDILRARLEHEMNIERARLDFEQQLKQKENELKAQQVKIRNDLLLKIGGIIGPILIAAAAFITNWLNNL